MEKLTLDDQDLLERTRGGRAPATARKTSRWPWLAAAALAVAAGAAGGIRLWPAGAPPAPPAPPPPQVTVARPLQRTVQPAGRFLGQFSAVDTVELRAQVGGTLAAIDFRDGQVVHKGDRLFTIDPRPFQIRLDQGVAQFQDAQSRATLSAAELWRAQQLKRTDFGTAESVDQRAAEQRSAQAAIDTAKAAIMDARLDLEFAQIAAPFDGRIGTHLVSVGSLVSGSRGGNGTTTPLATIVSLDPIHLDFDMSEADYLAFQQSNPGPAPHADVAVSVGADGRFDRHGTLDFIDNRMDRGSGTIHARATVPNPDLTLTPGQFARLRVALGQGAPVLLVPEAAVLPDQSRHVVMTVAGDGTVVPKVVDTGDLVDGLRVIRGGLAPDDRVVINGLVRVRPGAKASPVDGAIAPDPAAGAD